MPFKQYVLKHTGVYSALAHHYESLGNSWYAKENYNQAKDAYINAVGYGAGGSCYFHLASCYQKLGEIQSASMWFSRVRDTNYNIEATEQAGVCNGILIEKATTLIKQAEELFDTDHITALAKLADADRLLPNIESTRAMQTRLEYLIRKLEWVDEKNAIAASITQARAIPDIKEKLNELRKIHAHWILYKEFFSAEDEPLYEQEMEFLNATAALVQQNNNLKIHTEVMKYIQNSMNSAKIGHYSHAANVLEQATWKHKDIINSEQKAPFIPLGELETAINELKELGSPGDRRKKYDVTIIADAIILSLSLNQPKDKKHITSWLESNWQTLDYLFQSLPEFKSQFETEVSKIIQESMSKNTGIGSCLLFSGKFSKEDWSKIEAKLDKYFLSELENPKIADIKNTITLYQYLNKPEFLGHEPDGVESVRVESTQLKIM